MSERKTWSGPPVRPWPGDPGSLVSTVYDRSPITPEQFAKLRPAAGLENITKRNDAHELAYEGGIAGKAASIIVDRFTASEARIAVLEEQVKFLFTLTTTLENQLKQAGQPAHLGNVEKRG